MKTKPYNRDDEQEQQKFNDEIEAMICQALRGINVVTFLPPTAVPAVQKKANIYGLSVTAQGFDSSGAQPNYPIYVEIGRGRRRRV